MTLSDGQNIEVKEYRLMINIINWASLIVYLKTIREKKHN